MTSFCCYLLNLSFSKCILCRVLFNSFRWRTCYKNSYTPYVFLLFWYILCCVVALLYCFLEWLAKFSDVYCLPWVLCEIVCFFILLIILVSSVLLLNRSLPCSSCLPYDIYCSLWLYGLFYWSASRLERWYFNYFSALFCCMRWYVMSSGFDIILYFMLAAFFIYYLALTADCAFTFAPMISCVVLLPVCSSLFVVFSCFLISPCLSLYYWYRCCF